MIDIRNIERSDLYVLICVFFAAIVSLLPDSINAIALYAVLPSAFIVTFLGTRQIFVNKYFNLLTILYIWILISTLWATNLDLALNHLKQCLGSFILCYIITVKARDIRNIELLYLLFVVILLMDWYYAYNNIFNVIEVGVERINDEKLNANTLAYHTFYATFAIYILGEVCPNRRKMYDILFILMLPLSFFTAIYTASRQVLIIQLPLISILLYIRYLKNNTIGKKFYFVFIVILMSLIILPRVINIYDNSYLKERNELSIEDDSRTKLAKDAIKVGLDYFPLGVGPDNYVVYSYNKHFSHNTYTELFANEGIVGLVIYLVIVIGFVIEQWKTYRMYDDDISLAFFWGGVFFIIDGFFYSFYQHLWLISFFILITTHSQAHYETYLIDDYDD